MRTHTLIKNKTNPQTKQNTYKYKIKHEIKCVFHCRKNNNENTKPTNRKIKVDTINIRNEQMRIIIKEQEKKK